MALPPLDICKLEAAGVGCGVDMNEVWHVVCKLSDETDNIRITGNPLFDSRYLNYDDRKKEEPIDSNFYDRDTKVRGDWRTHFFTRTAQILLHSSNPKHLPNPLAHSERCDFVRPEVPEQDFVGLKCDCWGNGIDLTHKVVLQRLMTVPPHSNIAKTFSKMEQRSAHFMDTVGAHNGSVLLLVPFRYAEYFTTDTCTSVIDLLRMLVKGCQFRPKLLPVHCEFFLYSELYQLFLSADEDKSPACSLFTEFLSDLEHVEFYWLGGLRGPNEQGEMTFRANPSMHIPGVFLEAVLSLPSPKLDTVCLREYAPYASVDSCLDNIAPLFSSGDDYKSNRLPISAPYKGLKRLHVIGQLLEETSGSIISSIILHQTLIEGLELRCRSKAVKPGDILDPICHILTQPSVQFLVLSTWQDYEFKELFFRFLDMNAHCDISFATHTEEVVIPARDVQSGQQRKVLRFLPFVNDISYTGVIFAWLKEANVNTSLRSITAKYPFPTSKNRQCFLSCLATCRSLTLQVKGCQRFPFADCFGELSCNRSLQTLQIHGCLPFTSLIDRFCTALSAIYANCASELLELSLLNNRISSLPPDKLELFFKTLVSSTNLSRLSVNLKGNDLKDAHLDVLLKVWGETKTRPEFKSLLLDSPEQEERVAEMVLDDEW